MLSIWRVPEAKTTWAAAIQGVASQKQMQQEAQLNARLAVLADKGQLRAPEQFRAEGDGIWAVKTTGGLRAYGWLTRVRNRRAFVISHVILKKRDALDPADLAKAKACRQVTEAAKAAGTI